MKKSRKLFNEKGKKPDRRQNYEDFDEEYEDEYDDEFYEDEEEYDDEEYADEDDVEADEGYEDEEEVAVKGKAAKKKKSLFGIGLKKNKAEKNRGKEIDDRYEDEEDDRYEVYRDKDDERYDDEDDRDEDIDEDIDEDYEDEEAVAVKASAAKRKLPLFVIGKKNKKADKNRSDEVDDRYEDEEDDRYEDEDYREEDDRYEDEDYRDEEGEDRYEDEDYRNEKAAGSLEGENEYHGEAAADGLVSETAYRDEKAADGVESEIHYRDEKADDGFNGETGYHEEKVADSFEGEIEYRDEAVTDSFEGEKEIPGEEDDNVFRGEIEYHDEETDNVFKGEIEYHDDEVDNDFEGEIEYHDEEVDSRYEGEEYREEADDRYEGEDEYRDEEDDRYDDEAEYSDADYRDDENYQADERYEDEGWTEELDVPVIQAAAATGFFAKKKAAKASVAAAKNRPSKRDRYEDDLYEEDEFEDGELYEEDELYEDDEFDAEYGDDEGDGYDDEYGEDDEYYSDDDYRDDDDDYRDYKRSRSSDRKKKSGNGGAKILEFLKNTSVAERAAAVVAILLLVGGIATLSFYSKALGRTAEIQSFAEVGTNFQVNEVVGSAGLLAVADAERAKAMTAGIIFDEEEEEEPVVEDDAPGVTIKMTLTSIKSDMKIKFINSETKKLVASVPFTVTVVNPDGTTITYDDHDQDGIIYKNNLTAGNYTISPNALPEGFENYALELAAQSLTIKDTVEAKVVDVSNEIKKESQVNAAAEDTEAKEAVESKLEDTVEWVDSNQGSNTGEGGGYEEVSKDSLSGIIVGYATPSGNIRRMAARRGRAENTENPENTENTENTEESHSDNQESSEESGENEGPAKVGLDVESIEIAVGETKELQVSGPDNLFVSEDDSNIAIGDSHGSTAVIKGVNAGTTKVHVNASGYEGVDITVVVKDAPKQNMSLSQSSVTVEPDEEAIVNVSGPSEFLECSSENSGIASIVVDGTTIYIYGHEAGKTTKINIKAIGYNDTSFNVSVVSGDLRNMSVDPGDRTITLRTGAEKAFTINEPSSIRSASSSNEAVAKVEHSDNSYKIKAIAAGTANITFEADGYNSYTIAVTVTDSTEQKLNSNNITLVKGKTFKLTTDIAGAAVQFRSENSDIASVAEDGTITGNNEGATAIIVSCEGYQDARADVIVKADNTVLKDKDGNIYYVKNEDGSYREATYADYYNSDITTFYRKSANQESGPRHGWWTIDGKTYYYDKDGNAITGEHIIKGARYTFGSDGALSTGSGTMGIDVSKWNGNIDWNQVKNAGVSYVIIRCGYRGSSAGALIEDPKFRSNIKGAQAAGLKVGVYFFTQAVNEVEAVEEASMCINLCQGYNLSFPIYVDVESSRGRGDSISASQRTANIKAFCSTVQSAGYKAGVYSNKTWFTKNINVSALTNYKIWVARYTAQMDYTASRVDMWQYTSKGSVAGISGNVDINLLYN